MEGEDERGCHCGWPMRGHCLGKKEMSEAEVYITEHHTIVIFPALLLR